MTFVHRFPAAFLQPFTLAVLLALSGTACQPDQERQTADGTPYPAVHDDRLVLTLVAEDPDIVTPIGIAVDDAHRVYVLESHTHLPPSDYAGPDGDRIKVFTDPDGDGRPDAVTVFAEGFEDGMNLAFSPEGVLYLITSRQIWALHDRDGDGVSEARDKVAEMVEPEGVYDHAGLLGITFGADGWLYFSRGNTGSAAWRMVGSDGSTVEGYGGGGNIMRARPDGSDLEEVATGFWNPFDLNVDRQGRLLAADNDPDSRGPNRLVHVVPGGDYGYQSLYGGSGIHPYLAWNGELPGTLPYAAGLGEAPSGMLEANEAALPPDYTNDLLCTIWEESTINRIRLAPDGVSLTGRSDPLVVGGPTFRPVAMAAAPDGTIYITDWVIRAYPNHGRGRLWRLSTRPGAETMAPRDAFAEPQPTEADDALRTLYAADTPADFPALRAALRSDDPFVRHAATVALARPVFRPQVLAATQADEADVRLGALLALRRADVPEATSIVRRLLADPDPRVRRMALIWAGRDGMTALRADLKTALTAGTASPILFETYLATVRHLDPAFTEAYRRRAEPNANALGRTLPPGFVAAHVQDDTLPPAVQAVALAYLERPAEHLDLLTALARDAPDHLLRLEAVRSLATVPHAKAAETLTAIAADRSAPTRLRAEALLALGHQPAEATTIALDLLDDPAPAVQVEAARYLRTRSLDPATRTALAERHAALPATDAPDALREHLALLLGPDDLPADPPARPQTLEAWQTALAQGGDPEAGRRVFFSTQATCAQCHTIDRRGGDLGPDLSNVGRSKSRQQLIHSILRPSDEISPEWQGWFIETSDGQRHFGRQIDVKGPGKAELYTLAGEFVYFDDMQSYGTAAQSLMPDGLETNLTVSDLRDLVAFLAQQH